MKTIRPVCLCLVAAALFASGCARRPGYVILGPTAPPVSGAPFSFRFQSLDHPVLKTLRQREQLDEKVAGAQSQLDKVRLLALWTSRQWEHGDPGPNPPATNALNILDRYEPGKLGGFCVQYATVLYQACLSLGWQARIIAIGPEDNPIGHALNEVWIDSLDKWVVFDAFHAVYFVSAEDGVPLSALEIHSAFVTGQASAVKVRKLDGQEFASPRDHLAWHGPLLVYYYHLRLLGRTDHLDAGAEYNLNPADWIDWVDRNSVLWQHSKVKPLCDAHQAWADTQTGNPDHFNFKVNHVWIAHVEEVKGMRNEFLVTLANNMPGFAYYLVKGHGDRQPWPRTQLLLHHKEPMEVVPVNSKGVLGVPACFTAVRRVPKPH